MHHKRNRKPAMSTPFYDLASVVVLPSGYKSGKIYAQKPLTTDGQLTFTRASNATRVASNGLIEKVRTNSITYSNDFTNGAWIKSGCTITANYGTAPDGTQTASRAVFSGTNKTIYQNISGSGSVGSLYIKGTAGQKIQFAVGTSEVLFTLTGSWQRLEVYNSGSFTYAIALNTFGASDAFDVMIWAAQLETGDVATAYIATTSAAVSVGPVSGLPRLDYLNSTCPRLLLEPQRTNLALYSEQFNNAYWDKFNTTISANSATAPDGTTSADKIIADANNSNHAIYKQTIISSGSATISVYAKAAGYNFIFLSDTIDLTKSAYFNLSNGTLGTIGANATASIQSAGNGWYRCVLTFTATSGSGIGIDLASANGTLSFAGNNVNGVLVWGCQVEAGAYGTSYISTLGTSVTRVADAASKTGISSLIGTAGTVFFEGIFDSVNTVNTRFFSLKGSGTTYQNLMIFQDNQDGTFNIQFVDSSITSTVNITWTHGLTNGQSFKLAVAYASNDVAVYQNGASKGTDTSYTPITFNDFYLQYTDVLGKTQTKQALLFKTRLTNAQLAEITTL